MKDKNIKMAFLLEAVFPVNLESELGFFPKIRFIHIPGVSHFSKKITENKHFLNQLLIYYDRLKLT